MHLHTFIRLKYFLLLILIAGATNATAQRRVVVGIVEECPGAEVTTTRRYVDAITLSGNIPLVIPDISDSILLRQALKKADVIMLTGGEDLAPQLYGATPSPLLGTVNDRRDSFEYRAIAEAMRLKKPVVGICRGLQVINAYFGGTLIQDIPTECNTTISHKNIEQSHAHSISINKQSRLFRILGNDTLTVNSTHHQSVKDVAPGFSVSAVSTDGIIEGLESERLKVYGVQFHPERFVVGANSTEEEKMLFLRLFKELSKLK